MPRLNLATITVTLTTLPTACFQNSKLAHARHVVTHKCLGFSNAGKIKIVLRIELGFFFFPPPSPFVTGLDRVKP